MLYFLFAVTTVYAAQNYVAERDPPFPEVKKQYRLILRTPDRGCHSWRKVKPLLGKDDLLVSESSRDESGKSPGCRFLWVISPAEPATAKLRFELEAQTGPKENFEVPLPGAPRANSLPVTTSGVANENGTGPATSVVKGSLKLPAMGGGEGNRSKSTDMGTGF